MLYVFHGTDIKQSREKAHKLIDSLRAKKPDAAFEQINADNWSPTVIESHLGGQGLFSNKYIIFLDRVTENEEAKEQIVDFLEAMNESSNIFIALEGKLNAELKKSFEKSAEKAVVSETAPVGGRFPGGTGNSSATGKQDFNVFALADAVGSRDSIKAWTVYRQAIDRGLESESILGTLFWQVKSMILAAEAKTAGEAGLSPFVFGKAKRYAGNYSRAELGILSSDVITLYHDGHRGIRDLELATERLMLGLN
jgi:DNA polymerase III delta subunit